MSNNEINTLCGKTMKSVIYKYHQKKCDKCKGNNPEINIKFLNDRMSNKKGKKLTEMSIQDIKKGKFRKGTLRYITDHLIDDKKGALSLL